MKNKKTKNNVKTTEKIKLVSSVKFGEHNRPNTCYCLAGC